MIRCLYILYDSRCGICSRLRSWIQQQPAFVHYVFVPSGSPQALRLFPDVRTDQPSELVVITDEGDVFLDNAAWILTLWGLREYRTWSHRFARGPLRPFARAAWEFLSSNRRQLAEMLSLRSDEEVARDLETRPVTCERS